MRRVCRVLILGALVLVSCKSAERSRLERGVLFARSNLESAGRNPAARLSLQSTMEMGGTLLQYLAANAPPNADLPRFEEGRPSAPWTVVLRQLDGGVVVLEGYGEDLASPVLVDTARIAGLPGQ